MTNFSKAHGFARADVHLGNWRQRPYNTWSFSHVNELVPVARIAAQNPQRQAFDPIGHDLLDQSITLDQGAETVASFLARSQTDALLVQRHGKTIASWHAPTYDPVLPHIVFSVTKSVTGLLCAIAQDMGLLDPARPVGDYLPETRNGAYVDCPVQHVLDMRVSLNFDEDYLDAKGNYARYRRAMLWNPPDPAQQPEGLAPLLTGLQKGIEPHGGAFAYQSPSSDILGLLLERVTGETYASFAARHLWQKMGACDDAFITVDAFGTPRGAGGLLCTVQELARIGRLMVEPDNILPERWLADTWAGGDHQAWDSGDLHDFIPGGSYRNQWYRVPGPADALAAIGIHGQFLYLHRGSGTVIVKLASQHLPQDDGLDAANMMFLAALVDVIR
ncbi:serine hydrolase domain-containing protein [Yoonia sp.]|uniref:serine hydrolase domain-containing protein n=1 Tax=Yoonia sp. TaxID=2212373 RepID=UPI0039190F5C